MAAPTSSASACSGERWPPLESSPEVFNQFMWSLGVPRGEAEFHDVYGLDADALAMVPQPVLAVVFCFPDPPEDPAAPPEQVSATEDKWRIQAWTCFSNQQPAWTRMRVLEKDDDMARAHSLAANAGDTEIGDIVEEHYVCFTTLNGTLYELDGIKGGPIKHGPSSPESLLQDAVNVIKAMMQRIPNSVNFNVMVLSRKLK
ncbi:unnamed protein product [Triticum turgidum subsp. durum]|uniref:UCH catalytic domain-containing protein n=1 Tax=Triticum turgidum subsp. durum TaxID=4567 RepID=A0A9R1P7T9_TRITD|nr:unnamed protein product [Triticum turgidum subsp. durum]